jgi:hypothetical protein
MSGYDINDINDINNINAIYTLPVEIVDIIKSYIPNSSLIFVNKYYYTNYHFLLKYLIPKHNYEKYIRHIIRKDNDFVFQHILNDTIDKLFKIKNYLYKNIIYKNYLYFLSDYCIQNKSTNCRNVLNEFMKLRCLCQNRHKKNTYIHIRWKT